MSFKKKMVADLLFVVQIVGATVFCGAYFVRSLTDVTGSSVAQFGSVIVFLLFHLALSINAHRVDPSRVKRQAIATYVIWLVYMTAVITATWTNPMYRWSEKDSATVYTALILTFITLAISFAQRLSVKDPMVKALFAIAYKSIPQVLLAWKFLAEGATGTPGLSVVLGHFTIIIRLGQTYFMVKEAGWDRNCIWLAISEGINELSWIVATTAWLIVIR